MATNTSRTLDYYRKLGFECGVVERFNSFTKQRHDLFGIIDIIAIDEKITLGIQSCGQAFSEHDKKILESPESTKWVKAKDRVLILIGWRKLKVKRGGKAMRWTPRIKEYKESEFK